MEYVQSWVKRILPSSVSGIRIFSVTGRMALGWQAALPGRMEWRLVQIGITLFAQLCII